MPDITYIKLFVDYLDAIEPLGDAERGRLFTALLEYTRTGAAPQLGGNERFLFPMMRAQIDRDIAAFIEEHENISRARQEAGRKGGQAKASKAKQNLANVAKPSKSWQDLANVAKEKEEDEDKDTFPPKSPKGESGSFVLFWEAYPRKINRGRAWRAWKDLDPDNKLESTILSAVREQIGSAQWQQEGGRFIPSPDKWLADRRWEDKLVPAPPGEKRSYDMGELEQLAGLRLPEEL